MFFCAALFVSIVAALSFATLQWSGSIVTPRSPNVRELHTNLVFMNIPVEPEDIDDLIPDGLEADLFDGVAWVSVNMDYAELDTWIPFVETLVRAKYMDGFQHKVNIMVRNSKTQERGYLIRELYFDSTPAGLLKAGGAYVSEGVTIGLSKYLVNNDKGSVGFALGHEFALKGKLKKITTGSELDSFAQFITDRPVKFCQYYGGAVYAASVVPRPEDLREFGMTASNDAKYYEITNIETTGDLFKSFNSTLGLKLGVPGTKYIFSERLLLLNRYNTRI